MNSLVVEDNVSTCSSGSITKPTQLLAAPSRYIGEVGASGAYLLSVLAFRQNAANRQEDFKKYIAGKNWFYCPIKRSAKGAKTRQVDKKGRNCYRPLADELPWLSSRAINDLVLRLEREKLVEIKRGMNSLPCDCTFWYHVSDQVLSRLRSSDTRWFTSEDAVRYGINDALVLNVVCRDFSVKTREGQGHLIVSRYAISKDLKMPEQTVRDAFQRLLKRGVLIPGYDSTTFKLGIPNSCTMKGIGKGRRSVGRLAPVETTNRTINPHANEVTRAAVAGGYCSLIEDGKAVSRRRGEKVERDCLTTRSKRKRCKYDRAEWEDTTDENYPSKMKTAYAIAGQLGLKKKVFLESVKDNHEGHFMLSLGDELTSLPHRYIYCSPYVLKDGAVLFDYLRLQGDRLSREWHDGVSYFMTNQDRDVCSVTFRLGTRLFIMYRATEYRGKGGTFLTSDDGVTGFVIEPLENYLAPARLALTEAQ